jgi:predicted enzyme related to lactoylglutathione lyase
MENIQVIIYVKDQQQSRDFYSALFEIAPRLDVPGMTEYQITPSCILGLMPEHGIVKILGDAVPAPASGNGIPRCELYLFVADPEDMLNRAISLGAKQISAALPRDWGHTVAYCADMDGHILAFAKA